MKMSKFKNNYTIILVIIAIISVIVISLIILDVKIAKEKKQDELEKIEIEKQQKEEKIKIIAQEEAARRIKEKYGFEAEFVEVIPEKVSANKSPLDIYYTEIFIKAKHNEKEFWIRCYNYSYDDCSIEVEDNYQKDEISNAIINKIYEDTGIKMDEATITFGDKHISQNLNVNCLVPEFFDGDLNKLNLNSYGKISVRGICIGSEAFSKAKNMGKLKEEGYDITILNYKSQEDCELANKDVQFKSGGYVNYIYLKEKIGTDYGYENFDKKFVKINDIYFYSNADITDDFVTITNVDEELIKPYKGKYDSVYKVTGIAYAFLPKSKYVNKPTPYVFSDEISLEEDGEIIELDNYWCVCLLPSTNGFDKFIFTK